jgi:tRNA-intron endonuclease
MDLISSVYTEKRVVVPTQNEAIILYQEGYGSLLSDNNLLILSPVEVLFLVETIKISVIDKESRNRLVFNELLWIFEEKSPGIWTKYIVYRDLKKRGFTVKGGSRVGVDFLVYERGSFGKRPPKYIVHIIWEGSPETMEKLETVLKYSKEKDKILRLAAVDRRGETIYYTMSEMIF